MNAQPAFGVHSEVGQLRKVMVCSPGRAHARLTPSNCDALLFDDVIWVETAKRDHLDFQQKMRDRGIEVVEMHDLLTETLGIPEAKQWILDTRVTENEVGVGFVSEVRSYLEGLSDRELAETLIGGLSIEEFPETHSSELMNLVRRSLGITQYLISPLPNTLYTRDTTCWVYGGVHRQPAVLAGAHGRDAADRGDLPVPSRLRRQGKGLVGRPAEGARPRHRRGRRRHARRQPHHADRLVRAHVAPGHRTAGRARCSPRTPSITCWSRRCRACARPCTSTRSSPSPTATAC